MLRGVHVRGVRVRYSLSRTSLEERKNWRVRLGSDPAQLDAADRRKESQSAAWRPETAARDARRVTHDPKTRNIRAHSWTQSEPQVYRKQDVNMQKMTRSSALTQLTCVSESSRLCAVAVILA